ncbi:MAG: hypothetical protein H8E40_07350 [Chloroflexi bacterium]|nr:hypothetical protein [Chloroflexota bacterium]MBL7062017.1 hypothetical protein [Dehalococcoidia bacterium]
MKNGGKNLAFSLWELWKNILAAWVLLLILIAVISSICGIEPIDLDSMYQVKAYFALAPFAIVASVYLSLNKTNHWTERRRNILICVLFALALILGIVWLILGEILRQYSIMLWALFSIIPLSLTTSAASMLPYKKPRQPEEPPSNTKEREEAPSTPKPERAKIIGLAALLILLLAIVLTRKKRD